MNLELDEIIETLETMKCLHKESEEFVRSSAEELLTHLLKLKFTDGYDDEYMYHFSYNGLPSVRVYGHFINMIIISKKDGPALRRIKLTRLYEDDDCDFGSYRTDEYHSDENDYEIEIYPDLVAYLDFIKSLELLFKETENYMAYCDFVVETYDKSSRLRDKLSMLATFNEELEWCLRNLFEQHPEYDDFKGGFFMFPGNICLRYRGYYHNCIGKDSYSISLGYIKDPYKFFDFEEEAYRMDSYTILNESCRYHDYKTIHNLKTVDVTIYNLWEVVSVLRMINNILIDDFKKGSLEFVGLYNIIDYQKPKMKR